MPEVVRLHGYRCGRARGVHGSEPHHPDALDQLRAHLYPGRELLRGLRDGNRSAGDGVHDRLHPVLVRCLGAPTGPWFPGRGRVRCSLAGVSGVARGLVGSQYELALLATVGAAIAQPFLLNAWTTLSAQWFPKSQRATAVSLITAVQPRRCGRWHGADADAREVAVDLDGAARRTACALWPPGSCSCWWPATDRRFPRRRDP